MPPDIISTPHVPALSATSDMPGASTTSEPAPSAVETTSTTVDASASAPAPAPATTAPEATPATIPAPAPTAPASPPDSRTIAGRLSELATQRREADARADRFEALFEAQNKQVTALLERLNSVPTPGTSLTDVTAPDLDTRPTRESFPDVDSWVAAVSEWASNRAIREMEQKQTEQERERVRREEQAAAERAEAERIAQQNEQANAIRTAWAARREAELVEHPDFVEVAENPNLPITDPMALIIMNRDDGAKIAYHLGKNPTEAARIASLIVPGQVFPAGTPRAGLPVPDALAQAYELGKLAASLGATSTPNSGSVNNLTAAPAAPTAPNSTTLPMPVTPISGNNVGADMLSGREPTMEEWAAKRTPEILNARRPGGHLQ